MNACDFRAMVYESAVYCTNGKCGTYDESDPECSPIFADSEHDSYPVCTVCGTEHDYVSLTDEGRKQTGAWKVYKAYSTSDRDFDYGDAAQGLHWYLAHNCDGQWGRNYRLMCELDYTPGAGEMDADGESNDWYARLDAGDVDAEELLAAITVAYDRAR